MHSILVLVVILSIIGSLTYFINAKQKKSLPKLSDKQEPRFDIETNRAPVPSEQEETELFYEEETEINDNLLLDDPLLQPKQVPIQPQNNVEVETSKKPKSTSEEIIYLILAAKQAKPYVGYELLQALLTAGLRFGAMNIFHRHEDMNGKGKILFSMASASEPGYFEINKMGAFSGKALMLFLRLSNNKDLMIAFEAMLETAKQLVEDLDGDILDDERKILSAEKIEKMKKKILEFEQKQRIGDLFDT